MKDLPRMLFACLIGSAPLAAVQPAIAAHAVLQSSWDGFQKCRALNEAGTTAWAGTVNGLRNLQGRDGGDGRFSVRTCFSSNAACERWVSDIHTTIPDIQTVWYAGCRQTS